MTNAVGMCALVFATVSIVLPNKSQGEVKVDRVTYLNMQNCYKLSNGTVEVIVTTDMGPRVVKYGFVGGENVFAELPDTTVKTEFGEFKVLGGHRLWTAPEAWPRSYAPDNAPVEFTQQGPNSVLLSGTPDAKTMIQKELVVTMASEGSEVTVQHRLTNRNLFAVDIAPWALSIMAGGGQTIIPQEPYISHDDHQNGLLPVRPMVLWPFTDLTDSRWTFGKSFIRLKTDETMNDAQKIGVLNKQGWAAYIRSKTLFVKRYPFIEGQDYPDYNVNTETYTAGNFMELETLGPLRHLHWGATAEHTERWRLFKDVDLGPSEATLTAAITPLIAGFPR